VLVWEASGVAARIFGLAQQPDAYNPSNLQPSGRSLGALLTFPVIRWDGDWYLAIAGHGYALGSVSVPPRANFFPLYPGIVGVLGSAGIPLVLAAAAVSIGCLALALYWLGCLVELDLGSGHPWAHADAMRLTIIALAISPVAFFFSAAYAESLYLATSVGAVLSARRGHWTRAGTLAGLASATRGPGILLIVPLLWLYLYGPRADRGPDRRPSQLRVCRPCYRVRSDLAWLALVPVGVSAYVIYLAASGAAPLAFLDTQRDIWHHTVTWPGATLWHGARAAWTDLHGIMSGSGHPTLFGTQPGASVATGWQNLFPFVALLAAAPAAVGVWGGLPRAYGLYVLVGCALPLFSPVTYEPLQSLPRYLTVLFPLFIWLGAWMARHRRWRTAVLVGSGLALALLSAEFATWHFVA
jgi:hypothetical protein